MTSSFLIVNQHKLWSFGWDFIIIYSFQVLTPALADGFSLDFKRQQVSSSLRTFLSILANLNNAVVWMVSTCPPISKSSSPFTNLLGIVPSAPITISTAVTLIFHSFFLVLRQGLDIISLFAFFYFHSVVCRDSKVHYSAGSRGVVLFFGLFFFLFFVFCGCWLSLSLVVWTRLGDPFISQNPREVCASLSPRRILSFACTTFSYIQIYTSLHNSL